MTTTESGVLSIAIEGDSVVMSSAGEQTWFKLTMSAELARKRARLILLLADQIDPPKGPTEESQP